MLPVGSLPLPSGRHQRELGGMALFWFCLARHVLRHFIMGLDVAMPPCDRSEGMAHVAWGSGDGFSADVRAKGR